MSKKQNHTLFLRQIIFVQQHPLQVRLFTTGSELLDGRGWAMSSISAAIRQTNPNGDEFVIVREDSPFFDFRPGALALEHIGVEASDATVLSPQAFDEFAAAYTTGMNNMNALRALIPVIEQHAPMLQFVPRNLHHLIALPDDQGGHDYRHLPRFFMRHDMSEFEALVWLDRAPGQVSPKLFQKMRVNPERVLHVGGAWYAFKTLEEAVETKFMAPKSEIYRTREDG